jgi:hypothetical protein
MRYIHTIHAVSHCLHHPLHPSKAYKQADVRVCMCLCVFVMVLAP